MNEQSEAWFLEALSNRSRALLDRLKTGETNEAYIALDLMRAMLSAHLGGMAPETVRKALPVEAWRSDCLPVPVAFLRVLALGWEQYLSEQEKPQGEGLSLGQCLGIEARRSGSRGSAKRMHTRDQHQALANSVSRLLLKGHGGAQLKEMAAFEQVASENGVSVTTVRNAFRKYGKPNMGLYKAMAKTS